MIVYFFLYLPTLSPTSSSFSIPVPVPVAIPVAVLNFGYMHVHFPVFQTSTLNCPQCKFDSAKYIPDR